MTYESREATEIFIVKKIIKKSSCVIIPKFRYQPLASAVKVEKQILWGS